MRSAFLGMRMSIMDLNTHRQKRSKHFQINKIFNVERLTDKTHLFKKMMKPNLFAHRSVNDITDIN